MPPASRIPENVRSGESALPGPAPCRTARSNHPIRPRGFRSRARCRHVSWLQCSQDAAYRASLPGGFESNRRTLQSLRWSGKLLRCHSISSRRCQGIRANRRQHGGWIRRHRRFPGAHLASHLQYPVERIVMPSTEAAFALQHVIPYIAARIEMLRPHFIHPVHKRIALHEHPGVAGVTEAATQILTAIPGVELVDLGQPRVGYMCNSLAPVPRISANYMRGSSMRRRPRA